MTTSSFEINGEPTPVFIHCTAFSINSLGVSLVTLNNTFGSGICSSWVASINKYVKSLKN